MVKESEGGGDFKAIKPLQIAPENAGNRISEALKLKIFRGSIPPDPSRGYRLRRAFIRTPPPSSNYGSAQVFSILKGLGRLVVSFDVEDSFL